MENKIFSLKRLSVFSLNKISTFVFFLGIIFFANAQNIGDFRSKVALGNWNNLASWEVCTSTSPLIWSPATSIPGITPFVAPTNANSSVTITAGNEITIPNGMTPTDLYFGDLIIYGKLNISTTKTTIDFKTTHNLLIDGGTLNFNANKLIVKFPEGAQITITGLGAGACNNSTGVNGLGIIGGTCSNEVELWIGNMLYTTCTGNGGAPFGGNFCDVNSAGGSVNASATPSSLCSPGTVNLSSQSLSGASYQWSLLSGPAGYSIPTGANTAQQNISLSLSIVGTYVFKLAVTKSGGTVSDQVSVTVKPVPTAAWSSNAANVCYSASAQTTTLAYSSTTGSPTKYSIVWNATPTNSFAPITDASFTGTSSGGTINISVPAGTAVGDYTGSIIVKNSGGCISSSKNFTVSVKPVLTASVSITSDLGTTICSGTNVTFTAAPTNGGTSPTYQWKLNGVNVGTNSATYSNSTLVNGDKVSVVMTSNATPCLTGSPATSNVVTMTVNPNLAASVSITSDLGTTTCSGTNVTFTAAPTNGGTSPTYQWKLNGLNVGTNSATYSNSTLVNGDKVSVVMTSNATPCLTGSPATSNVVTMTVNALPIASVSGNANSCSGSDVIFTISGTPNASVTYNINGGSNNSITLNSVGTAQITSPAATSNQTLNILSVSNGTCIGTGNSVTVTVGAASVYDGTTWSNGLPNGTGLSAIINADYSTASGNITACSCTVNAGKKLTIDAGTFIDIQNEIVNNGTLVVESDGNLIQRNNAAVNTGNISVKRNAVVPSTQYMYWSTPVEFMTGQNFKTIYPNIPAVIYYNEANNLFYNSSGANILGRGLAVKGPSSGGPAVTAEFKGKPWNGIAEYNLTYSGAAFGYHLVGNPYPSNIDLVQLYNDNSTKIESTIQFWDNTNNTQFSQQGSGYNGASYAIFIAAGTGTSVPAPNNSAKSPSRYAVVGQGFMVRAKSTIASTDKKLRFTDNIRKTNAGVFFNRGGENTIDDGKFWLRLTTPKNNFNTIAVTYSNGASNGFESFDALQNSASDMFYSIADGQKLAIQGRTFPFLNGDIVTLGAKYFEAGIHKIELVNTEGIFANGQNVYLKDNQTGIITNLNENAYTFAATAGENTGRFEIVYKPETLLAMKSNSRGDLEVYRDGESFVVVSSTKKITMIEVYDAVGRMIYKNLPNSNKGIIDALQMSNGIYILKIHQNGEVTTRKVLK